MRLCGCRKNTREKSVKSHVYRPCAGAQNITPAAFPRVRLSAPSTSDFQVPAGPASCTGSAKRDEITTCWASGVGTQSSSQQSADAAARSCLALAAQRGLYFRRRPKKRVEHEALGPESLANKRGLQIVFSVRGDERNVFETVCRQRAAVGVVASQALKSVCFNMLLKVKRVVKRGCSRADDSNVSLIS